MFKTETKITCDYSDVEEVIFKEFKNCYEIMPMEEVGSSQYAAVIEEDVRKGAIDEFEQKELESLYGGKPKQFTLSTILKHLANLELLQEGSYIIDVNW